MVNEALPMVTMDTANMTSPNLSQYMMYNHFTSDLTWEASFAGAALGVLVISVGTFGNVLVILAVLLCKPLLKSSNMFIVSLAVCDLFQTIMVRPLFVHTYIRGRWEFGPQVCLYALYASNLAILESILHVSTIAFYRYLIIVHATVARKFQNPKAVVLLIALIYVCPLLIILLPSLARLRGPTVMNHSVSFNTHIMFCAYNKYVNHEDEFSGSLSGIIKKGVFLGCAALFLFYCYIRIFQIVRLSGRTVNIIQGGVNPTRLRREMTLLKTVIVVFLAFVVSYLPVTVMYAVDKQNALPDWLYVISVILLWCSSSVNWMIYGLMNKQFLVAYRYVLCGLTYTGNNTTENGSGSKPSVRELHERRMFRVRKDSSPEMKCLGTERLSLDQSAN